MRTAKIGPDLRLGVLSVSNKDDARKLLSRSEMFLDILND